MVGARSEVVYHASLSRRRSPVQIRSGPPFDSLRSLMAIAIVNQRDECPERNAMKSKGFRYIKCHILFTS